MLAIPRKCVCDVYLMYTSSIKIVARMIKKACEARRSGASEQKSEREKVACQRVPAGLSGMRSAVIALRERGEVIGFQPLGRDEDLHVFPRQFPVLKHQIHHRLFVSRLNGNDKGVVMIGGQL